MEHTPLLRDLQPPKVPVNSGGQYFCVAFIFTLQGIGFLLPWNVFVTIAPSYYIDYKLAGNETSPAYYQTYFFSWLGLFSQVPNLLINAFNVITAFHGTAVKRIYLCIASIIGILAITLTLVFVDTSAGPEGFFWFTMASMVLLSTANGLYENCVWGYVADFPPQFVNYVVIGNNVCGVFISFAAICSLVVAPDGDVQTAASIYFSVALLIAVLCLASFFILSRLPYARYHRERSKHASAWRERSLSAHMHSVCLALKVKWREMLSVFLTFFVTIALFPAVIGNVQPCGQIPLPANLFQPIMAFLHFNVVALVGNLLADTIRWRPSPNVLLLASVARLAYIPLFLLCNFGGDQRWFPALFKDDIIFAAFVFMLGISQGYFSSLAMMSASGESGEASSSVCGSLAGFCLIFGVCAGANFSFIENLLVLR